MTPIAPCAPRARAPEIARQSQAVPTQSISAPKSQAPPAAPPSAPPAPVEWDKRKKRKKAPRKITSDQPSFNHGLSVGERENLSRLLTGEDIRDHDGIVCSAPWADEAVDAMERGDAPRRKEFAAVYRSLHGSGVYPPGGSASRMVTCFYCGRDCPMPLHQPVYDGEYAVVDSPGNFVYLNGRTNGACVDCIEDLRAPPETPEEHFRRTKFQRVDLVDGDTLLAVYELNSELGEFKKILSREERKERRHREFESEKRLLREIKAAVEAERAAHQNTHS